MHSLFTLIIRIASVHAVTYWVLVRRWRCCSTCARNMHRRTRLIGDSSPVASLLSVLRLRAVGRRVALRIRPALGPLWPTIGGTHGETQKHHRFGRRCRRTAGPIHGLSEPV